MNIDGEWIRARLTGRRGEKADLARHMGIKEPEVSKILSGRRRVQPNEIEAVLRFFGEPGFTDEEREMIRLYRLAGEDQRHTAIDYLRVVATARSAAASRPGSGDE